MPGEERLRLRREYKPRIRKRGDEWELEFGSAYGTGLYYVYGPTPKMLMECSALRFYLHDVARRAR